MTDIVIVGDDWDGVARTSMSLYRSGFTVASFGPGQDPISAIRDLKPEIVIDMRCDHDQHSTTEPGHATGDPSDSCSSVIYQRIATVPGPINDHPETIRDLSGIVAASDNRRTLIVDDIELDPDAHQVSVADRPVELSPTQFKLLKILLEHADQVLSKQQLLNLLYDYDGHDPNLIEVHISALRRQIDLTSAHITTVRGVGYVIRSTQRSSTQRSSTQRSSTQPGVARMRRSPRPPHIPPPEGFDRSDAAVTQR